MNLRNVAFLITSLLLNSILMAQSILRIEPPNWWAEMENPRLQILLYGKAIGDLQATTPYKGIKVLQCNTPGNPNYLFIELEIDTSTQPGIIPFTLNAGDRIVASFEYPILTREKGSSERKGFNTADVIYLITPDRFANGDLQNDDAEGMKEKTMRSDKNGRHGGDIEGMHQHLDYIQDMGFTSVWPTPVLENNMSKYSYHGYAITDFYRVDARMGTNESYKAFCAEARQRGIKPIMDMIVNHCGSEHWWMTDLPSQDWINFNNEPYTETNHVKSVQMDPYVATEDRRIAEEGWFVKTMPDLNMDNPWFATYLIQNSIWWIEYAGLQGIRMDTYLYPEEAFMSAWSKAIMDEYPAFNIVGEVWHDQPEIVSYWQKGSTNNTQTTSYLPALFDFPVHNAMVRSLNTTDGWEGGWRYLYEMLAMDFLYPNPNNLVVFADNHDMPRLFTMLQHDQAKLKNALAFIMTTRGIPQLYYGTEALFTSPATRDDGLIRADMPGGWPDDTINAFTGYGLRSDQQSFQLFVKRLLNWRKNAHAVHQGQLVHFFPEEGMYVYFRYDNHQKIMVVLNKNHEPATLPLARFKRILGGSTSATEILTGKTISLIEQLQLETAGPLILELH